MIAAFNVLEHLYTRVEVDACLRRVAAHLAPGGAFAFDVQLPDLAWLLRDPTKRWARTRFTDPTTGRAIFYSTNHDYDPVGQIALIRLYYEPVDGTPGRIVKLSQRKFFPPSSRPCCPRRLAGHRALRRFFLGPLDAGPRASPRLRDGSRAAGMIPRREILFLDEDLDHRTIVVEKRLSTGFSSSRNPAGPISTEITPFPTRISAVSRCDCQTVRVASAHPIFP